MGQQMDNLKGYNCCSGRFNRNVQTDDNPLHELIQLKTEDNDQYKEEVQELTKTYQETIKDQSLQGFNREMIQKVISDICQNADAKNIPSQQIVENAFKDIGGESEVIPVEKFDELITKIVEQMCKKEVNEEDLVEDKETKNKKDVKEEKVIDSSEKDKNAHHKDEKLEKKEDDVNEY